MRGMEIASVLVSLLLRVVKFCKFGWGKTKTKNMKGNDKKFKL